MPAREGRLTLLSKPPPICPRRARVDLQGDGEAVRRPAGVDGQQLGNAQPTGLCGPPSGV